MTSESHTASDSSQPKDVFWTAANALSLLRVALVAPTLWALHQGDEGKVLMLGLVASMIVSDWVDGYLARKLKSTSRWGHILDPLADKVAINSIAVTLVYLKGLPVWVAAVVVGRDVAIVLAGVFLLAREDVVQPSNVWGKLTSLSMSSLLIAYATDFVDVYVPLLSLSGALLGISTLSYGWRFLHRHPEPEESPDPETTEP